MLRYLLGDARLVRVRRRRGWAFLDILPHTSNDGRTGDMSRRATPSEFIGVFRVLTSGRLSRYAGGGRSVTDRFEAELADFMGARRALAVNSGTSALVCALVGAGIGPGDEVLVPAYTWIATAAAPLLVGAVPVLVDVDETLTMDPDDLEARCSERTRAVIPVHMDNLVCDMDRITAVAARRGLTVIEDACQSVGVTYRGRLTGTVGHVGAYSFNQHKNISSGEGGAVVTNDDVVAERARMYHDSGAYIRDVDLDVGVEPFVGMNLRMTELASAVLRPQLRGLGRQIRRRQERRAAVARRIQDARGFRGRIAPHNDKASAVSLVIQFDEESDARAFSSKRGVTRLIDTDRHVYTNWSPVVERRFHHAPPDPLSSHPRAVNYAADVCPRTLSLLARSCRVALPPQLPRAACAPYARYLIQ